MSCPYAGRIAELLRLSEDGEETDLFALLDAARDEQIYRMATRTGSYTCLETGLRPNVRAAAPHLVRIRARDTRLLGDLLDAGWGKAWGMFVVTRAGMPLEELRLHLHALLRVELPSGDRAILRFYDPRGLRLLLPTCSPEQLSEFFASPRDDLVRALWMEGDQPDSILRYRFDGRRLDQRNVDLAVQQPEIQRDSEL